jgi:hypothetical protein
MLRIAHLTGFPLPAAGLPVAEQRCNRPAAPILAHQISGRGTIAY